MDTVTVGNVVISTAGRDKGQIYIVKEVVKDYVMLINGKGKTLLNPKKKNIKHIHNTYNQIESIKDKLLKKQKLLDNDINSAISKFISEKKEFVCQNRTV